MTTFGRLVHGRAGISVFAALIVLGVLILILWGQFAPDDGGTQVLGQSLARPTPAQPTIVSGPSAPTSTTVATFTYTDTTARVTFACSLDGADFRSCPTSGITYSALAEGSHTFRVRALSGDGTSPAASRTWSVDLSAPVITVSFPASSGVYNAAGWSGGCPQAGVCGSASDPSGVAGVQVAILQQATSRYWNGTSFASSTLAYQAASGTTAWHDALGAGSLADGSYTLSVRASDTLGNTTPAAQPTVRTFSIDTAAPPAPTITQKPDDPTSDTSAQFSYTDAEAGVSFRCALDGSAASACGASSGVSYSDLAVGGHCFTVAAVDAAGNVSSQAVDCWTILEERNFPISGTTTQLFAPGVTQPLDLVFTNPFDFDIKVVGVSITVQAATTRNGNPNPGCSGTQNLVVSRAFSGSVVVARNSTRSLSGLGVPAGQWPLLTMPDLPTNQDACKSTTFALTYQGTAVKP